MIELGLTGIDFIAANTDHQALASSHSRPWRRRRSTYGRFRSDGKQPRNKGCLEGL
jgi:cell division GTPase FtsZ